MEPEGRDLAGVWCKKTRSNAHERGFSSSVGASDERDLTGLDGEIDLANHEVPPKPAGDASK